ncbi:MAG: tetratricopeptide repeat protein [Bacteroidales bacterium]|jgi:tetratricopeptide (TPR) repeat protein|nr:tetratricopeptide repeat protein [Bacteroidales bacterium]
MSKKKVSDQDQFESVENALSRTEHYIEQNQKSLTIIVLAIIVIVGGYLGYQRFVVSPKEKEAQSQMWMAEQYFARDSFNLAIHGDGNYLGFLDIVEEYSITKSANLANYYIGISYLRLGNFEEAIDYLKAFESDDKMVAPIAYGAIGDANMELGNTEEALRFYEKAVTKSENEFTTPIYLMKVGFVHEQSEDYQKALETYQSIKDKFPESAEGRQIDKYIARVEALMNS